MKVTESTKAVARAVLDYIERNPEQHNQDDWLNVEGEGPETHKVTEQNLCNTTMCAAGTAVFVTRPLSEFKQYTGDFETDGAVLLGLDLAEATDVFYSNNETAIKLLKTIADGDEVEFTRIVEDEYVGI